jgi:putative oxidoreductase
MFMTPSILIEKWRGWSPQMRSLLRIVAALLFMLVGTAKLFAFPTAIMPGGGAVKLVSELGLAGLLEGLGGFLMLLGLFTRPVAFILSGEMAVAYFQMHFPKGFWPATNGGMAAALFCFVWLYFSAADPGPWSLDRLRTRKGDSSQPLVG